MSEKKIFRRIRPLIKHSVFALGLAFSSHAFADGTANADFVKFAQNLGATRDVAASVADVLEPANVRGACDRHFARLDTVTQTLSQASLANKDHVSDMIRCGKWIFFFGDFESQMAIPQNILKATAEIFPEATGPAWSKTGLIENPFDPGFPVGFVKLKKSPWGFLTAATGQARGIACATCHFGKMPDGRYAAGMPNQKLDFGRVNALLSYSTWRADSKKFDDRIWPVEIQAFYKEMDVKLKSSHSPSRALFDVAQIVSWAHASNAFYNFTGASRPLYADAATWLSGTKNQYYASSPLLPVVDKSYWMSAPQTWEMTNYPGSYEAGEVRPLSNFSPVKSAEDFVNLAYIFQTGLDTYATKKYVDPLVLYFRTLKTPENLSKPNPMAVEQGRSIFKDNCVSCHNGRDGETLQAYSASELNTPEVLVDLLTDYIPTKKLSAAILTQTISTLGYAPFTLNGIYGRKLKGIYARQQLMINGGVKDLNQAFCIDQERDDNSNKPLGLRGDTHLDLCQKYSIDEKLALKAFLDSWY